MALCSSVSPPYRTAAADLFLSGLVFAVSVALVQYSVDQVLDCDKLAHRLPELVSMGGCGFAFCVEFGAFFFPVFYGKGFMEAGQFALGEVVVAEFWFVVLLKLLPAFFEFDLLQLVVDGLGFYVGLGVALQLLEFLDPLTVGFDGVLQRLTFRVDI